MPPGLSIRFDGSNLDMPVEKETVEHMEWYMVVDSFQTLNDQEYVFDHWSNDVDSNWQTFPVPTNDTAFTVYFTLVTSIDTKKQHNDFVYIFPNPAKDFINIKFNGKENILSLKISDLLSNEKISINNLKFVPGENIKVNIRDLLPGIYFLQVSDGINKITKKILIDN